MRISRLVPLLGVVAAAAPIHAQGVSLWLGAGRPVNDTTAIKLKSADLTAGVQFDIPLFPIAFRAEGMVSASNFRKAPRTFIANAVIPLRLPGIQPYAIGGYGAYSYGKPAEVRGYNYGAGVRFGLGRTGFFGEVRRHEKLRKNVGTIGITF